MEELEHDINKWWPKLPELNRGWILEHLDEPLSSDALTAIVHTRGYGPAAAYFVDGESSGAERINFFLTSEERDWIRKNGN